MTEAFYKSDCADFFLETLSPELTVKGVAHFFRTAISEISQQLTDYFGEAEKTIVATGCVERRSLPSAV
jgi:hypothetical protein